MELQGVDEAWNKTQEIKKFISPKRKNENLKQDAFNSLQIKEEKSEKRRHSSIVKPVAR